MGPAAKMNVRIPNKTGTQIWRGVLLLAWVMLLCCGCRKHAPQVLALPEASDHWPGFMGPQGRGVARGRSTPAHWGRSNETAVTWSLALDRFGYSSPVVWGNRVFVTQADELSNELLCVDLNAGRLLWSVELGQHNGITGDGLRPFSDQMYASATPVTDGRHVFALFSSGDVACVDVHGRKVWQRNLGFQVIRYGAASSPVLCDDKLIVQLELEAGSYLVALRPRDGKEIWRAKRPDISWATPVLYTHGGKRELLCTSVSALSAHSLDDGRQIWASSDALGGECGSSAAWAGELIYVSSIDYGVRAYKAGPTPELVWEWEDGIAEMASPLAYGGNVFVATQLGNLVCLDGLTGALKWSVDASDQFFATPVCIDGKLYAVSADGAVITMNAADTPGPVRRFQAAETVETIPAFVGGRVIIRAPDRLICYGE